MRWQIKRLNTRTGNHTTLVNNASIHEIYVADKGKPSERVWICGYGSSGAPIRVMLSSDVVCGLAHHIGLTSKRWVPFDERLATSVSVGEEVK